MDGSEKPSPLRNSKAANRPFQSPFCSVRSENEKIEAGEKTLRIHGTGLSPGHSKTPEKRTISQPRLLSKKICLQNSHLGIGDDKEKEIDEDDLKIMRERIRRKKEQLEHVKQQLLYREKHKPGDLRNLTKRWLTGCQEALIQFQKDISEQNGNAVSMAEILSQLGIPSDLVQYSVEDEDFF